MRNIVLVLTTVFLFAACSSIPPEPPLTQEQIETKKANLLEGFNYFSNKRMVIVDGDSVFNEFEIVPLSNGTSAEYTFYNTSTDKKSKLSLTDCFGRDYLKDRSVNNTPLLTCSLQDKYDNKFLGSVWISVAEEDYNWKDGRVIPTHKTVISKKGDLTLRIMIPTRNSFFVGYTEFAVVKFKN